jgi:transcription elongation factor SPT5
VALGQESPSPDALTPPSPNPHPAESSDSSAGGKPAAAGADSDDDRGFVRRGKTAKNPRKTAGAGAKGKGKGAAPARKKAKRKTYVEEAAEVAADDEDEGEDNEYAELKAAGVTRDEYQARVMARYAAENKAMLAKKAAEKSAEQIAEDIEAKYAGGGYVIGEGEHVGELRGSLAAHANLPDMRDPKLWMMRCKDGMELMVLTALLNKFVVKAEAGERLGIMSAVNTSKGVIFVEAYREAQVRQAVAGINDLWGWKPDAIKLVPVPQMTAALNVSAARDTYRRGMFVRFTRGLPKGDVAQVVDVIEGGAKLVLRFVPRVNYKALGKAPRKGARAGGAAGRPPQRFFSKDEFLLESGKEAEITNVLKWNMRVDKVGSNTFYSEDGMAMKEVKADHVTAHGPAPSVDEVAQFKKRKEAEEEDEELDAGGAGDTRAEENLLETLKNAKSAYEVLHLEPGDSVHVVRGDLAGLYGRVVVVNPGNTFTLQPSAESSALLGLTERLEIPFDEVAKTFDVGDHVKVFDGMFRGETGTVLASRPSDGDDKTAFLATLLLDSGQKTVEVFVKHLSKSTEVVVSVTSLEGYDLYDLVEIKGVSENKPDAGCVVGLGQRDLSVMLASGSVQKIPVQEIRGKANFRGASGMAVAQGGAALAVGDVVRIIQGAPDIVNLTGTIKHIYGMRLFLHNYARTANSGIFLARPQQVVLASRKSASGEARVQIMTTVGRAFGGARGKGQGALGRSVQVLRGRFKGRLGMIRNETDTHYSVEIHQAQQKHLTTLKDDCKIVGDEHGRFDGGGTAAAAALGGATPAYGVGGGVTPGMGGATPMYGAGGATPMYRGPGGGITPVVGGGQTPMYGRGAGGATPLYGAGGQTPMYPGRPGGGTTPMYPGRGGAATPLYGATTGGTTPGGRGGMTPLVGGVLAANPADAIRAATAKAADAACISSETDLPWIDKGVRVSIKSGAFAGKDGTVRAVSVNAPTASVHLDVVHQSVTVQIADMQPQLATTNEYVRVLSGSFANRRVMVLSTTGLRADGTLEDDAEVVVQTDENSVEVLPFAIVVRVEGP